MANQYATSLPNFDLPNTNATVASNAYMSQTGFMTSNLGFTNQYMTQNQFANPPQFQSQNMPNIPKTYTYQVEKPKYVEVPQTQIIPVVKQVPVPETLHVPIPKARQVPIEKQIERNVPVPVDLVTNLKFALPKVVPKYNVVKEKVVVPRYIEVVVPTHMVQVNEFESTMIPGPAMKDLQWPQYAVLTEDGEQGTQERQQVQQ